MGWGLRGIRGTPVHERKARAAQGAAGGVSGGSKPQTDGGRIPLAGVVLAALPTQSYSAGMPKRQALKTHQLTEVGTAV